MNPAGDPEPEGRLATVAGAVLLGGASRRMGRDKASLLLDGVPLAVRVARELAALFDDVLLVGGSPPSQAPGRPVVDPPGPTCALRGVVAALEAVSAERVLVVATDLPLVTPDLLLALVAWREAAIVLPRTNDGLHPLCAVYRKADVLPVARDLLKREQLRMQGLVKQVDVAVLEGSDLAAVDPGASALLNVNGPEDLARAEALLKGSGS